MAGTLGACTLCYLQNLIPCIMVGEQNEFNATGRKLSFNREESLKLSSLQIYAIEKKGNRSCLRYHEPDTGHRNARLGIIPVMLSQPIKIQGNMGEGCQYSHFPRGHSLCCRWEITIRMVECPR